MSPVSRYEEWLCRLAGISPLVLAGAVAWLVWSLMSVARTPIEVSTQPPATPVWPAQAKLTDNDWTIFHNRSGAVPNARGSLSEKFRMAGFFFEFGTANKKKAILVDRESGAQHILSENDLIEDAKVVRIFRDRVVMLLNGEEQEIWRESARGLSQVAAGGAGDQTDENAAANAAAWLGGKIIGDNRWVFEREKLLEYYNELLNEPERLVAVFDSLKPLYDERSRITGYELGVEGEAKLFDAIGMQPGDVVRTVNSMQMTSRRRAEYFIREFVSDRANAFVIDIERNGNKRKLIYEVK